MLHGFESKSGHAYASDVALEKHPKPHWAR